MRIIHWPPYVLVGLALISACQSGTNDGPSEDAAATGGASLSGGASSSGGRADNATGGAAEGQVSGGQLLDLGSGGGMSELFDVKVHLASEDDPAAPTTVGIVTWSIAAAKPTRATIQFGLTTDYGMEAPVDVEAAELRTLLLGMKPEKTYNFRIVAEVGGEELVSNNFTLETGSAPAGLIQNYDVLVAQKSEPGFVLTSYWGDVQRGMVFIVDAEGDIVWWYESGMSSGVGKAAISDDGRDMWMISGAAVQNEPILRVGMDGLGRQSYAHALGTHDIIPVEGDVMAFVWLLSASEINRAGQTKTLFPELSATAQPLPHCNAIAYNKAKRTYLVSDLTEDVYMFPRVEGTAEEVGYLSSIIGPNSNWGGLQHGLHLLSNNHLLMFANGGGAEAAAVIEYNLDDGEVVWSYDGQHSSANFGGVQRLPGGNTLITYSNPGIIHEITPEKETVLEITTNKQLGYSTWRASLYGETHDVEQ